MRILIAEDDAISRCILSALLSNDGYDVVETANGLEAWEELQKPDAPRLAILDWMMPEMDGLEVVRRVRTIETNSPYYLIMLTARDEADDTIIGLDAGADDYITKPFDAGILQARVAVGQRVINMQKQLASHMQELRQVTEAQAFLLQCGLPGTGEDFFESLARYLSKSLAMEYVCIDRLEGDGLTAQTVAVYNDGKFETNVRYALKDTPCGEVADRSICCYPRGVQQLFPRDAALQELMAESYFGTTLWDSKGQPIGLIAIIGYHVLEDPQRAESLLRLIAPRAAGELERLLAEDQRDKLQLQLNQAQKMESVGRLAGGVAHDFNNKLSVIIGYVDLALMGSNADNPLVDNLKEIRKAAESSADLTRQLLAFARKQTVMPKVLDLNDTVTGMLAMLRRLIGEDIKLTWQTGAKLWPVNIDPSQIDQMLANLCINARDAIGGIGTISITTETAVLDADYCSTHQGLTPGDYVSLMVSDSGCGMDAQTQANIFEPFFTTKEVGQGTGLGLASVYGAIKQNGGYINVYSEPGIGTTFTIYLPRYLGKNWQSQKENTIQTVARGSETILLVEDEVEILKVTTILLKNIGYSVLPAATPGEAMRLAREHAGEIHLLLTDVIMPEMNGRDLARNLLSLYPDLKRLFMSGYTADIIAERGMIDEGVNFIQKPFSMPVLAGKVRDALEG